MGALTRETEQVSSVSPAEAGTSQPGGCHPKLGLRGLLMLVSAVARAACSLDETEQIGRETNLLGQRGVSDLEQPERFVDA